jgi:dolichol-phosphate mannosyltransferase
MSVIALDTDLLRMAGYHLERSDPSDRMRGWKSATSSLEKMRNDLEAKLGEKLFLIADARDRASEISFYLRDKRVEGPNHPPVYIPESQDMVNQFSFWPRYDEFIELKPGMPRPESETYTEENGVNPFVGRDALFIRSGEKEHVPHNIRAAFQSTESVGTIEMTNSPAVSVIVPVFNEEQNLSILQAQLRAALSGLDYEIIFVDDGSLDGTAERVEAAPNIRMICFEKNAGQSAAMYAGLKAAGGVTVVLIDGDLQNDPADIPKLLAEIARGADLVCGYRAERRDTLVKRVTSWIANAVRSRFTKDGVRDTGCTLKAMRRECVGALVPFKGMHRFIPALVKAAGYRLVEIPVNHRPRRFGQSKYGLGNRALRATTDMFGVRWLLSRRLSYKIRKP